MQKSDWHINKKNHDDVGKNSIKVGKNQAKVGNF